MTVAVICISPDDPRSVLTTEAVNRAMAGIDVPADIPLDAWQIAESIWTAVAGAAEPGEVFSNIEIAARAVMTERTRCAKIAGDFKWVDSSLWCPGSEMHAYHDGQEWASKVIRDRILGK